MISNLPYRRFVLALCTIVSPLFFVATSHGQAPPKPILGDAEVTANDVYVRSGASANHYPVCKLNAGDHVTVLGERGDWYEIKPPPGVFSYVSGDFVDTTDDKTGVINGNRVNIRAGSSIAEYASQKYAVQTQLSRGTTVTILERLPDGFLRIEPPAGATAWISRQFLGLVPNKKARPKEPGPQVTNAKSIPELAPVIGTPTQAKQPTAAPDDTDGKETFHGLPLTEHRSVLLAIDSDVRSELERPVLDRSFTALIDRYQTVAQQDQDDFAQRYAQRRIGQLTHMKKLADTVRTIRGLSDEVEVKRRRFIEERAKIGASLPPIAEGLEIQGELRVSALYPRSRNPQRYRLVRSSGDLERTIAYVEIPNDVSIDIDRYLGRYVGVRASARRLQAGGVDPVPIFLAQQLVLLQEIAPLP